MLVEEKIKIKTSVETILELEDRMRKSDKVYFTRFGDNDIFQMIGCGGDGQRLDPLRGKGNNRTTYTHAQAEAIKKSFSIKDPNYMKAVTHKWPLEKGMHRTIFNRDRMDFLHNFLTNYLQVLTDEREFYNPVCFHYLSIFQPDYMRQFIDEFIYYKKKMYIGWLEPWKKHKSGVELENIFGEFEIWMPTPRHDSYNMSTEETRNLLIEDAKKCDVVISACGQLSRAISGRLWNEGVKTHFIDIGSIVDGIAGLKTRNWNIRYGHVMLKNLRR